MWVPCCCAGISRQGARGNAQCTEDSYLLPVTALRVARGARQPSCPNMRTAATTRGLKAHPPTTSSAPPRGGSAQMLRGYRPRHSICEGELQTFNIAGRIGARSFQELERPSPYVGTCILRRRPPNPIDQVYLHGRPHHFVIVFAAVLRTTSCDLGFAHAHGLVTFPCAASASSCVSRAGSSAVMPCHGRRESLGHAASKIRR